jgi:GTP-binding protein
VRCALQGRLCFFKVVHVIKFADEAFIIVSSGKGGDGCVAFRREKFVPMGGPAGGDGGRGGDVVFEVRRNLRTLSDLRYHQTFKAQNGQPGMGSNCHGKNGEDAVIAVPPGSIIKDADTGEILKDFGTVLGFAGGGKESGAKVAGKDSGKVDSNPGRWVFLRGGNGGWGNTKFKSSVNQAPRQFQPGKPGETRKIRVELQLIADIGFVGFPNAGKSSLLDFYTNARPKIAPYPFTTKIPNLGIMNVRERDIILADIPGIIEGAHDGAGLGLRFLKHIARTKVLAFLIDLSDEAWEGSFAILQGELASFSPELAAKPRVVIGTKLDLPETEGRLEALSLSLPEETVLGISVFSGQGLDDLKDSFLKLVVENEAAEAARAAVSSSIFADDAPLSEDDELFSDTPLGPSGPTDPETEGGAGT